MEQEPQTSQEFEDYRIQPETIELLKKNRLNRLFFTQKMSFNDIFDGEDVILNSQPGTGKTVGYLLPIIERLAQKEESPNPERKPQVLIVVNQLEQKFEALFQIKDLTHGKNSFLKSTFLNRIESLEHDIVILTYNEIDNLVENFGEAIQSVKTVVFDDSDRLLTNSRFSNLEQVSRLTSFLQNKPQTIFVGNNWKDEFQANFEEFVNPGYKFHNGVMRSSFVRQVSHHYVWSQGLFQDFNNIVKQILVHSYNSKKTLIYLPNDRNPPSPLIFRNRAELL